jgi:hypothetical protein
MDRPILVSGPLIKPILNGTKTLTSRLTGLEEVNVSPGFWELTQFKQLEDFCMAMFKNTGNSQQLGIKCPYGGLGSTLWVRENWYVSRGYDGRKPSELETGGHILAGFPADGGEKPGWGGRTRASIHMPRHLSRISLVLTGLACERVKDLPEYNAKLEGVVPGMFTDLEDGKWQWIESADNELGTYYDGFKKTWIDINGRESWDRNPWVWRLYLKLLTPTT